MKKDIHPKEYRLCVFKDMSTEFAILTKSCVDSESTIKWEDGNEYPLVKMEISIMNIHFLSIIQIMLLDLLVSGKMTIIYILPLT